jgi:hypothetical protein
MIIDSIQQLQTLYDRSLFVYPVLQDNRKHRVESNIIALVLIDINTKETFSVSKSHPDGLFQVEDYHFLDDCKVFSYDTILFKYAGYETDCFTDVQMQYYLQTNKGCNFETPSIINHYTRYLSDCGVLGSLVSLPKHEAIAYDLFTRVFIESEQPGLSFYQHRLLSSFYMIEKNGIQVKDGLFEERFGKTFSKVAGKSYTQYNYYTTTGRPSNRFDGINFAALNKEDGTRECFQSRFEDGQLIEIDFNAYHPRLIASLVGYDFGSDDVYEHLAKHYNNTETPTKTQITSAKEATFRQIYGGISKQYMHVPFFKAASGLARQLWIYGKEHGYIESPISGRRLIIANYKDITEYTLFNYFIQMYETEFNVLMLQPILLGLNGKRTKPVLYTYDSILFDVPEGELEYLLETVIPKAIDIVKFPIKTKIGSSIANLAVY